MSTDSSEPSLDPVLTGLVTESGRSRGKTLAAWNGVPTGQDFLLVQVDEDVVRPSTASGSVHVWFADSSPPDLTGLVGQRVCLRGRWQVPPVEELDSLEQPRQQPLAPMPPLLLPELEALSVSVPAEDDAESLPSISSSSASWSSHEVESWAPVARQAHFQATVLEVEPGA